MIMGIIIALDRRFNWRETWMTNDNDLISYLMPVPVTEADIVLVNNHPAAVWMELASDQKV